MFFNRPACERRPFFSPPNRPQNIDNLSHRISPMERTSTFCPSREPARAPLCPLCLCVFFSRPSKKSPSLRALPARIPHRQKTSAPSAPLRDFPIQI